MAIKKGDKIKVEYTGKFENGEVFDTSKKGEESHPLEFEVGAGQLIKGFDKAVVGMEVGEEKTITIKPEEAYGNHNSELKRKVPRAQLPADQEPKVGMMMGMKTPDGKTFPAKIVEVTAEEITIDLNHPLAGKTLIFEIKVVEIVN